MYIYPTRAVRPVRWGGGHMHPLLCPKGSGEIGEAVPLEGQYLCFLIFNSWENSLIVCTIIHPSETQTLCTQGVLYQNTIISHKYFLCTFVFV